MTRNTIDGGRERDGAGTWSKEVPLSESEQIQDLEEYESIRFSSVIVINESI